MDKFQHFKIDTEQKLNRRLLEKEVEFLQWVFERYEKEQQEKTEKTL